MSADKGNETSSADSTMLTNYFDPLRCGNIGDKNNGQWK